MTKTGVCPVCDTGNLTPITFDDSFTYKNQTIVVEGLQGTSCDTCGATPILTEQIRVNQRKIADAKRRAFGMFTSEEIRYIRESLHLSQSDCAVLFGGGTNAFSKYERGEVIQSEAMDSLLYIAHKFPFTLDALRHRHNMLTTPRLVNDEWQHSQQQTNEAQKNVIQFSLHLKAANSDSSEKWKQA